MRLRNLLVYTAVFTAALFAASPSWAQGETRFGVWDNSTNPNNVMTYEPYEKGGMKITVSNPSKPGDEWSYVTLFDGKFRPVTGQKGSETAVEIINEKSTRIYNKRDGVVYPGGDQHVVGGQQHDQQRVHPHGQGRQDHGRHARDLHPPQEVAARFGSRWDQTYLNEATSADRASAIDRFPSRRGVQCSTILSRQPAPHRFV